ncbi:MAG: chemotaxis response regulator protein-glutamate methylesterase [Burkholderiales bacterium]|nr:chemotaxis response regulator protein-glutamate methylesterase [Burkholderiales bacterium]
MQRLLTAMINAHGEFSVVGAAQDPFEARERIKMLNPDVITLDVEMPRMDGVTFLEKLMRLRPMPVVMVSSSTEANAEVTLRALELGAVDFVTKPKGDGGQDLADFGAELCEKLRVAAGAECKARNLRPVAPVSFAAGYNLSGVIAIGASTGGTEAIKEILLQLPLNAPPVVIVQHMPEMFTRLFAKRLNDLCPVNVTEAVHGERLQPGHAYVAPGNWHLSVARVGRQLELRTDQAELVNRHRPAVDVLFDSVANSVGPNAVGVLLTGMGRDGVAGLGAIKRAGGFTAAQARESCVVFGMPKAAIEAGYAQCIASIEDMAAHILTALQREPARSGEGPRRR